MCHGDPHLRWTKSLIVLKMLVQFRSFVNERYCLQLKMIVTFRRHASFIIKALCLVDLQISINNASNGIGFRLFDPIRI